MGYRIEVHIWVNRGNGYAYEVAWEGESLLRALWEGWRAHRQGVGCVRVVWRPR